MQTENITALALFEAGLTKTEIKSMAINAVENVLENGNCLKVAEALSAMELFIKEVKDDKRFKDYVREETAKHPKGFISNSGAKIEMMEAGTKYCYDQCNDTHWELMSSQINGLIEQRKERENFLRILPSSGLVVTDEMTGETIKIFPPSKTSISSYKISLAK